MLSPRLFWLLSVGIMAVSLLLEFFVRKLVSFGFVGDVLFYAGIVGFAGFFLRQKWGWSLSMLVQLGYMASFIFPSFLFFGFFFQIIGLSVLYLSKPYFS